MTEKPPHKIKLLHLKAVPILAQLQLEEALLRTSEENFCILNEEAPPAIVLGISGKIEELVAQEAFALLPLIRRFSGGGTVVVDEQTLFVSFLGQKELLNVTPYPEPIMRWSTSLYQEALGLASFTLKENDYAIEERKCGGNAQSLLKHRWLHHTSFLWDYCPQKMELLLHPKKAPLYRANRSHVDFLTTLNKHLPTKATLFAKLKSYLHTKYLIEEVSLESLLPHLELVHRKSTEKLFAPFSKVTS